MSGDGGPVAILDAQFGHTYPVMPSSHPVQTSADVTVYPPTSSTSQQYAPAPQRAVFVTFKVMFKATSENVQPGGRFAFEVRTADGQHYNLAAGYGERDTLLNSTLHNGEVLSGTMTADLPAAHGTLTYAPAFEAGPTQVEWPF